MAHIRMGLYDKYRIRWRAGSLSAGQFALAVNSSNVVRILMASIQTVRSTARVVFTTHANPALRATLSQDPA